MRWRPVWGTQGFPAAHPSLLPLSLLIWLTLRILHCSHGVYWYDSPCASFIAPMGFIDMTHPAHPSLIPWGLLIWITLHILHCSHGVYWYDSPWASFIAPMGFIDMTHPAHPSLLPWGLLIWLTIAFRDTCSAGYWRVPVECVVNAVMNIPLPQRLAEQLVTASVV
jgi:hypothetical protein